MDYVIFLIIVVGVVWLVAKFGKSSQRTGTKRVPSHEDGFRVEVTTTGVDLSRYRRSAVELSDDFNRFWVPQGQPVTVQGYSIDRGLLYIGKNLASVNGYSVEPALINPDLKVDKLRPSHSGESMGYWPSYEEIPPSCRAAYLAWLADGRRDPNAYIGYVFLYFYGLERRVLHDYSQGASSGEERAEIFKEVKRLLKLYGDDNSFAQYGWQFLFTIYLSFDDIDLTTKSPVVVPRSYDLPVPLKVGLGQFAKAGKSIPGEWALAWVLQDREIRLRTPARRCSQEFAALFKHLYRERFGEGIVVKPNKTPVSATYRPASGGMRRGIDIYRGPSLPDITILKRPRTMLSDIADQAANKLDAYSRFIGKENNTKDSLQGAALLPPELDGKNQHPALEALQKTLESYLGDRDTALLPVGPLLEHFPIERVDRFAKKEAVLLAQLLEKLDLGMEPDVRFSGIKPKPEDKLVVFRQEADAPSVPSQAYEAATLVMRLAAMVSTADGEVSADEERHLEQHIESSLALEPGERRRLHAYMQWFLAHDRGTTGLKQRLEDVTSQQKETIGRYLVTVATADGHIDPDEVKILQKLYRKLELDPERVMAELHSASAEPVTVKSAAAERGFTVPEPPLSSADSAKNDLRNTLDPVVLQRKLEDTARVSDLLHDIFTDDEEEGHEEVYSSDGDTIGDLDMEHSAFLRALGTADRWDQSKLDSLADRHGLLLEGALDTINEAAYNQCNAPCIDEEDDGYSLDREIYEEITK